MDESSLLRSLAARAPTHELAGHATWLLRAAEAAGHARPRMATCRTASRPAPGAGRRGIADRQARLHRPGLDTDQQTRPPAPATRKPGPRAGSGGYRVTPVSAAQYLSSWSWILRSRAAGCAVRGFW